MCIDFTPKLRLLQTNTPQCWTPDHLRYLVPAYASLIIYVIGIPVSV